MCCSKIKFSKYVLVYVLVNSWCKKKITVFTYIWIQRQCNILKVTWYDFINILTQWLKFLVDLPTGISIGYNTKSLVHPNIFIFLYNISYIHTYISTLTHKKQITPISYGKQNIQFGEQKRRNPLAKQMHLSDIVWKQSLLSSSIIRVVLDYRRLQDVRDLCTILY